MDQPAKRPKWYTPLNEKLIEVCRSRFAIDETKTKLLHSYSVILGGRETRLGSRKYVRPAYGRTYLETGIFLGKKYDWGKRSSVTLCARRYVATINHRGRSQYLGSYNTAADAAASFARAAAKLWGAYEIELASH